VSKKNWRFFLRQPDGSVKVRYHYTDAEALLIEEAAEDANPHYWSKSMMLKVADEKVQKIRARRELLLQGGTDAPVTTRSRNMQLLISNSEGTLTEVVDNLEEYNLDKPLARAELMEAIQRVLARVGREGGQQ
jgi:hypothetical protein